jgi:glucokinase
MGREPVLAGDVGGTKTVLALYEMDGDALRELGQKRFPSADYETFDEILEEFLASVGRRRIRTCCVAVAGAVLGGRSELTNLPWTLDERRLGEATGVRRCRLLNDLEAAAYGMLFLPPEEYVELNPAARKPRTGNVAVIAAGTGLGEAILYWDGEDYHPIASEGGHADFAPHGALQIDLLRHLHDKLGGHVSYERVLSGPGIANIYGFLRDTGHGHEPNWLAQRLREEDPGAVITQAALQEKDPLCHKALELFVAIYGSEAGNCALKCLSTGGVFVGGGIAPKILDILGGGHFMRAFADKGRFRDLLETLSVRVALNPDAPLLGAARYALRL